MFFIRTMSVKNTLTITIITVGLTVNDILERLYEIMAEPVTFSIRQLCVLRERARVLERWADVEFYTEKLWALGYYD